MRRRNETVEVPIDCPAKIVVKVDQMHLKQVVLNLARNSKIFVEKGFVRLRVEVLTQGGVNVAVEDSGPGIPESKPGFRKVLTWCSKGLALVSRCVTDYVSNTEKQSAYYVTDTVLP